MMARTPALRRLHSPDRALQAQQRFGSDVQRELARLRAEVDALRAYAPFARAFVTTDGSGGATIESGFGFKKVDIVGSYVELTFEEERPSTRYVSHCGRTGQASGGLDTVANAGDNSTTAYVRVTVIDVSSGTQQAPSSEALEFAISVYPEVT